MRLIDADAKETIINGATDAIRALGKAPTVDLWHYPSKGEYPKEDEEVLCELLDGTHDVGKYCPSKYKEYQEYEPPWDFGDYLEDYIECWQYIVSPKEER